MTPILHVAWKEYRLLRSLWLTFFALAMLLQVTALLSVSRSYASSREFVTFLFAMTVWLPAFYALGCGATMFAAEKDDGTYEWLRVLPIDGLRVFAGKLLFAVPSTGLLFAAVVLITRSFGRGVMPLDETARQLWGAWGVAALEALAWGALISLVSRRPLLSAVIAAAVGSTVTHVIVATYVSKFWLLEAYTVALPARLVIVAMVFAVDLTLARGWLANPRPLRVTPPRQRTWTRDRSGERTAAAPGPRWRRILRLCWQDWRQSRRAVAGYGVIAVIGGFAVGRFLVFGLSVGSAPLLAAASLSAFLCTMVGATTFRGDHEEGHYRFLAEHAISPRDVWWARELYWGTVALICGSLCILSVFAWNTSFGSHSYAASQVLETALPDSLLEAMFCYLAIPFIAGQFASLLLRSPLLAATAGIAIAAALMAWAMLMARLSIAWWWTVLPLAAALLVATRMRLTDWLTYRDGWRRSLRIVGTVLVPIALVVLGVIWFRVHEIPATVKGVALTGDPFDVADYDRPATDEENTTALFYVEALNSYQEGDTRPDPVEVVSQSPRQIVGFSGTPGPASMPAGAETPPLMHPVPETGTPVAPSTPAITVKGVNARLADERRAFLEANAESLQWMLSATQREPCLLRRPRSASLTDMPEVARQADKLAMLLLFDGKRAEAEGKLDVALDRYMRVRRFAEHIAHRGTYAQSSQAIEVHTMASNAIATWADHPGQTRELITLAVEKVRLDELPSDLAADAAKTYYVMVEQALESGALRRTGTSREVPSIQLAESAASRFPWERARQERLSRLITYWALQRVQPMANTFRIQTPWVWLRSGPLASGSVEALRQLIGDSSSADFLFRPLVRTELEYVEAYQRMHARLQAANRRLSQGETDEESFAEPASEGFGEQTSACEIFSTSPTRQRGGADVDVSKTFTQGPRQLPLAGASG